MTRMDIMLNDFNGGSCFLPKTTNYFGMCSVELLTKIILPFVLRYYYELGGRLFCFCKIIITRDYLGFKKQRITNCKSCEEMW